MTFDALHAWHVTMRGLLLSPSPVLAMLLVVVIFGTAGQGATEVHWMLCPGACDVCIANLLRVACFLFSVCLGAFY